VAEVDVRGDDDDLLGQTFRERYADQPDVERLVAGGHGAAPGVPGATWAAGAPGVAGG
jgi:hypothetical protein